MIFKHFKPNNLLSKLNTPFWTQADENRIINAIVSILITPLSPSKKKTINPESFSLEPEHKEISTTKICLISQLKSKDFDLFSSLQFLNSLNLKTNYDDFSEQDRFFLLETYQKLRYLALNSHLLTKNPDWNIDDWEIDLKIILILLTINPSINQAPLKYILWHSPHVRRIKLSLSSSSQDYHQETLNYIQQIYDWSQNFLQLPQYFLHSLI